MDNNLSNKISAERVLKILKEPTDSGIPRINRIKVSAATLYSDLDFPRELDLTLAKRLIIWNDELDKSKVPDAIEEIKNYEQLVDLLISSIDKLDIVLPCVKAFNYKALSAVWDNVTSKSKLINRINNLKFLSALYSKKNNAQTQKFLFEKILGEIYNQKAYLSIFKENMKDFIADNKFLLGMLLYDIPGDNSDELNFIKTLKAHGIKI